MSSNPPFAKTISTPALRYHGGKFRLASWILQHLPPHRCYIEPFGGAASVLLQKPRSYAEVYNDLDGEIVNFFRVVRDPDLCRQLIESLILTPYARTEFEQAYQPAQDPVEMARRVAVRAQMGFGSAGATKGTTGFRVDTKRPYNTAQHLWARYPQSVANVSERFSAVLIENRDATEVIRQHDAVDSLHFIDPPYVMDTRVIRGGNGYYRHELTNDQHIALLTSLKHLTGMVVVSGYDCDIYRDMLYDWTVVSKTSRASAYRGTKLATEMLWLNPACVSALNNHGAMTA